VRAVLNEHLSIKDIEVPFFILIFVVKMFMETILQKFKDLIWACLKKGTWDYPVIHRRKLTENPPSLILPLLCWHVKGKLSLQSDLTILLVHNYEYETLMEKSLRYGGIENFTVLPPPSNGAWHHSIKISTIFNYLKSGSCKTKYVLYCDSEDVILRDDPMKAIRYLQEENCSLLFSKTKAKTIYKFMPYVKAWTDRVAKENGYPGWYINAGVFVAQTSFLREVLELAMTDVTDADLPARDYKRLKGKGTIGEHLPDFPKGCGWDQTIFRYIHPQFYPRMKPDYRGRLALR
jgi:hypothetical protein